MMLGAAPLSLVLADLNGDGLPDITTSGSGGRWVSVVLNRGDGDFAAPTDVWIGFLPLGHRLADLNGDGALDLVAWKADGALVLAGRVAAPAAGRFRRGDASGDGSFGIEDPIVVINRLFLAAGPLLCEDAADANDDGEIDLSDPLAILNRLFLGGDPLPPPGPQNCGADPTAETACPLACRAAEASLLLPRAAFLIPGHSMTPVPRPFRRGDANDDGPVARFWSFPGSSWGETRSIAWTPPTRTTTAR